MWVHNLLYFTPVNTLCILYEYFLLYMWKPNDFPEGHVAPFAPLHLYNGYILQIEINTKYD